MYLRFFLPIVFAALVIGVTSSLPEAEAGDDSCIFDGNSEVCINPAFTTVTQSWLVDDIDHLAGQELFICEIENVNEGEGPPEFECVSDPLGLGGFDVTEGFTVNEATFVGLFEDPGLDVFIEITWELIGGLVGSNESTLNETIEITRTGEGTSTFRFFQETDFDLAEATTNTFVQISSTLAEQENSIPFEGPPMRGTVSVSPPADEVMAAEHDEVADAIIGDGELDGTTGPFTDELDYVFGFSWDFTVSSGGEPFVIEKTKQLEPIVPIAPIASGVMYGSAGNKGIDPGSVFLVSQADGSQTFLGDPTTEGGLSGLAFDDVGRLWGSNVFGDGNISNLLEINPSDGSLINDVGPIQLDEDDIKIQDLGFDPISKQLFGTASSILVTIDRTTAIATFVGTLPNDPAHIGFAPDGTLFMVDRSSSGSLFTIDPTNGDDLTQVVRAPDGEVDALGVSPSGVIFVSGTIFDGLGPQISTLDTAGTRFIVGSGTREVADLAFRPPTGGGGGDKHEPPTIGKSTYGFQVVTCGVAFDGQCFTITAPFHEEFKLYEMMSGTHTISITMYCANGVSTCNYAAIGIMPYSESMANTTWKIELYKDFEGNLTTVTTDPEGFLGTVTVTTQIIDDKFWIVSFTVDFKNKDTGPMMFGVQARDNYNAVRNWYLNEGVEFKDSDAYPSILTEFDNPLEIDSLCLNEDPTYRNSCAFAEIRDLATQNAEETLRQMLNGEYRYK